MTVKTLLVHLEGVRQTGPDRWIAKCPAHDDGRPSLSIRETADGTVLVHCFAECGIDEIVNAAGIELSDLFPRDETAPRAQLRQPFPAADVLRALATEVVVVQLAAEVILRGEKFTDVDADRLALAATRIRAGMRAGGIE